MLAGYTQLSATAAPSTSRINTPSAWSKPQHDAVHRKGRTPYLERCVAGFDQRRQLLAEHLRRGMGDDEVKADVDEALPLGLAAIILDALPERHALDLQREWQNACVAARRRGGGAGGEVVSGRDLRTRGLRQVDVAVDAARQHQEPTGIDLAPRALHLVRHRGDAAAADTHIGPKSVCSRRDRAAADGEVELRHEALPGSMQATRCEFRSIGRELRQP